MSDSTSQGDHPALPPQAPPYSPPPAAEPAPPYPPAPQQPPQPPYPVAQQYAAAQQYPAQPQYPQQYPDQQYPGAQPYPSAQPYAPSRPTSGLAVTSLVTGIAGIVLSWTFVMLLASIAAVITGHMALKQTRQNPALGGRGMAIAGIILGYAGVAFLALSIIIGIISAAFFGTLPFLLYGIAG
jgi:hypothetical protein